MLWSRLISLDGWRLPTALAVLGTLLMVAQFSAKLAGRGDDMALLRLDARG